MTHKHIQTIVFTTCTLCLMFAGQAFARDYNIAGMFSLSYSNGLKADWGNYALQSAKIAIEDINKSGILGEDTLVMKDENITDYRCRIQGSDVIAEKLFKKKDILALIGADCSGPAVKIARVGEKYKIPTISYGANAESLSSVKDFPYFIRVVSPSSVIDTSLVRSAKVFGAEKISIFHTTDAWGKGGMEAASEEAHKQGLEIDTCGYSRNTNFFNVLTWLGQRKAAGIKHFVIIMPVPDTYTVYMAAKTLGMVSTDYYYYSSEMLSADNPPKGIYAAIGSFAPKARMPEGDKINKLRMQLGKNVGKKIDPNDVTFYWGVMGYDNAWAVAHAIKLAKDDGVTELTGEKLMPYLRKINYNGLGGNITIRPETNDRASMDLDIMNLRGYADPENGYFNHWLRKITDPSSLNIVYKPVGVLDSKSDTLKFNMNEIILPGGEKPCEECLEK
ncbi:ABC-type branched-chain amino acid transport system, substrate-binding protein [Maridesulfovibrio ferrireducens]|uniref:ABC-type branched-chain amino acid transport system, substrate-binding protein n=1 Tax=Maridesulfovibrio ferrireducens TaxID=246191 RepID=A0A1G9EZ53_9BACT|nr:ABC transporter substrate-binding protein [Maridesulfovibrio ferrireducens]SDK81372.1 ABC-type branched-chain amino acid transport system, substrate-binding protein [Maridesulfovibrio ferrireducens]